MTDDEVRELLDFCAHYDPRLPAASSLAVWTDGLDCAWVPNLSLDEAQAAVAEHYRCTPVRVTAGDILRWVRDDRAHILPAMSGMPRYGVPPNDEYRAAREALERRIETRRRAERGGV
jgi:hypothetical protein